MEKSQAGTIVQLFQGAYPNTEFVDSVLSAATWYLALKDYDFEETKIACMDIIKSQENGYKVNVAAVIDRIGENRKARREKEKQEKFWRDLEESEKNKVSPEKMKEYIDKLYNKLGLKRDEENK